MTNTRKFCTFFILLGIVAVGILYLNTLRDENNIASLEIVTGGGLPPEEQAKFKQLTMPPFSFDLEKSPPAPDYSMQETWAALPFREDEADVVPANSAFPEAQGEAAVDVFFVHPTGYTSNKSWNAPWDDPEAAKQTSTMMRNVASVFNAASKVYAPRYRQCTLYAILDNETQSGIQAINLAYSDVERAFEYYLEFYNDGRPFILAGHSQGSLHAFRLLQEKIIGTPLADRLVSAYIIGYAVPESIPGIEPSRNELDTGTVIGWNTYTKSGNYDFFTKYAVIWLDGSYQKISSRSLVQTNPLSWKLHGITVSKEKNLGSLPASETNEKLPELVPRVTGADTTGPVLIITKPQIDGFSGSKQAPSFLNANFGDYHIYDYSLFYENIRKNVVDRVNAFKDKNDKG